MSFKEDWLGRTTTPALICRLKSLSRRKCQREHAQFIKLICIIRSRVTSVWFFKLSSPFRFLGFRLILGYVADRIHKHINTLSLDFDTLHMIHLQKKLSTGPTSHFRLFDKAAIWRGVATIGQLYSGSRGFLLLSPAKKKVVCSLLCWALEA